jgi:type I restriction enzyme S subunit
MQTVPLCELGEIVSGSTPKTGVPEFWDGDIPWITPADLSNHEGIYFHGVPKRISAAGFNSCSTTMLPAGSILFSSRAPIGHCALTAYPACTNQGFKNIVPNRRLDPVYGYFALKFLTPAIVAMGRGATFTEINKEIFESVEIPYCDLSEQRQIHTNGSSLWF